MSYSDKGSTGDAETLVDTLTIDRATLSQTNLSQLNSSAYQTLSELSHELTLSNEMETEDSEVIVETQEEVETEEVVQTELGAHEIEIETERNQSPEEILPDVKSKGASVPPLRPLTIAPKPAKVPIAVKPIGGQQLLLLQGTGSGQAIKLVSSQGQELNLANISLSRPLAIKPAMKQGGNLSMVQPKPIVMKKVVAAAPKTTQKPITTFANKQGHFMVIQKSDEGQVKLVPAQSTNITTLPTATKTLTLQQAQEMGLIAGAKLLPQAVGKQTLLLNKPQQKTIKIVPQVTPQLVATSMAGNSKTINVNQVKSPTKILPATQTTSNKLPQRLIFKTSGTNQTLIQSGQIIQVAGSQTINSGQLHQINIPGKGMQYIKFVTASTSDTNTSIASPVTTVKTTVQATSTPNVVLSEVKPLTTSSNIAPRPIKPAISTKQVSVAGSPMIMLPSYTIPTHQPQVSKVAIPRGPNPGPKPPAVTNANDATPPPPQEPNLESNGMRPRKPCNCTKSQCLKLYCDCFANGEFCYMCNCMNCYNNLENEDHRQRAIKTCLERNPNAFRPKIGKAKDTTGDVSIRKHTKGCNCKRSGCLKNYCECYEAKIACSSNCKCVGCRNIEDSMEKKNLRITSMDNGVSPNNQQIGKSIPNKDASVFRPRRISNTSKQPINFITDDVIEATCQCLLTISDSAEEIMQDVELTKQQIIEEFGRCLTEIIDCSTSRNLN